MGICSSKKVKINNPSEHLTGDLDDELLYKKKHQELVRNYVINGDNLLLSLDFSAAIESYEKALEDLLVMQMQYDNSTFILSTLYQRIALAYRYNKKHDESLEWECKAVVAREKKLPETHEQVAGAYSSLSVAYEASGNYKEALKYCEKALKTRNKLFGGNHWVVAVSTERLGMLKAYEGDFEEAIALVIQAKQNLAAHFTEESCYVGYNYMKLGEIYCMQEKYDVAQEQFKKAAVILEGLLPSDNGLMEETGRNSVHGEVILTFSEHSRFIKYERARLMQKIGECWMKMEKIDEGKEALKTSVILAGEVSSKATKEMHTNMVEISQKYENREEEKEKIPQKSEKAEELPEAEEEQMSLEDLPAFEVEVEA